MNTRTVRQVHFIINNLAPGNYKDSVDKIRKAIFPEFKDWFANYLVVKRAAQVSSYTLHSTVPYCQASWLRPQPRG